VGDLDRHEMIVLDDGSALVAFRTRDGRTVESSATLFELGSSFGRGTWDPNALDPHGLAARWRDAVGR